MIGGMIDIAMAMALFFAGRLALTLFARAVRGLRRLYDRSRNRQSYRFGRQAQGVRVHKEGNAL